MRIALFFFIYVGANGLLIPYLPPYLLSIGFSPQEISRVVSISPLLMIFAPPLWGLLADRLGRPGLVLKIACVGATFTFYFLLNAKTFMTLAAIMTVYSVFWTSIGGLADTIAVAEARKLNTDYARLRVWGSIGFIVTVYLFSEFLSHGGEKKDVIPFYFYMMVAYSLLSIFALPVQAPTTKPPSVSEAFRLAADPALLMFLLAIMLHQTAMQPYYNYFAIHVEDQKIDPRWIGASYSFGVITEIAVMWSFRHFIRRVPILPMICGIFVVTALRWYLTSIATSGVAFAMIQMLHGLSFGAVFIGSILHLEQTVPEHLRATGRMLFTSMVHGCGGILGNAIAGMAYDRGKGSGAFQTSACIELLAPVFLLVAMQLIRRRKGVPAAVAQTEVA
jgi:MFS transporter, PPP family, 3-phenylpropionic acid transporter